MYQLASRDLLGYNFECENLAILRVNKLTDYIKFHNPLNKRAWKRHKEKGVDLVIKVNGYTYYIEESYQSGPYDYKRSWFKKCRIPRFKGYRHDNKNIWVNLPSRPESFSRVLSLSNQVGIITLSITQLIDKIKSHIVKPIVPNTLNRSLDSCCNSNTVNRAKYSIKQYMPINLITIRETVKDQLERLKQINGPFRAYSDKELCYMNT